jgi:hypothetical protein
MRDVFLWAALAAALWALGHFFRWLWRKGQKSAFARGVELGREHGVLELAELARRKRMAVHVRYIARTALDDKAKGSFEHVKHFIEQQPDAPEYSREVTP